MCTTKNSTNATITRKWIDRATWRLTKSRWYYLKRFVQRWRHRQAGQDRQRPQNEDDREVAGLLQRVEAEVATGLRRKVEGRVLDGARAGRRQDRRLDGHELQVMVGDECQHDEHQPVCHEQDVEDEVPVARHPDCVTAAGHTEQRAECDRVVLGRPDAVPGHWSAKAQPLATGRAFGAHVQARMVSEDLPAGSDDHHHEEEVGRVRSQHPA